MTAERLLLALWSRNSVAITVDGDRIRVEAPRGALTADIREALAKRKEDVLRLLAVVAEYRVLLDSAVNDSVFLDAQARLVDELGPALATAVRQAMEWARPGLRHG